MSGKVLKLAGAAALFLAAGGLAGCVSVHTPPVDRRVTVAADLGSDIWVTDVRCAKGASDQDHYVFQANMVNNTSSKLAVTYRVTWLDASGVQVDSLMSHWQHKVILPKDIVALKSVAPTPDTADFRFYVMRDRR